MCNFFSGVTLITGDVALGELVDSHEAIIKQAGWQAADKREDGRQGLCRWEYTPLDSDWRKPLDTWEFAVDGDKPDWWTEEHEATAISRACAVLTRMIVFPGQTRDKVGAGERVFCGGVVSKVYGGGVVSEVYGGGGVSEVWGGVVSKVYGGGVVSEVWGGVVSKVYDGGMVSKVWGGTVSEVWSGGTVIQYGGTVAAPTGTGIVVDRRAETVVIHGEHSDRVRDARNGAK